MINSKPAAWGGVILTMMLTVVMMVFKIVWWTFIPLFFMFMEAFCELASLYLRNLSASAAKTLQNCAIVFGVLMLLSILGVFIAWQILLP